VTEEEKAPDTMPVPTPPLESGVAAAPRRKRPEPVIRPVDAMLAEIEKREGVVEPTLVLVVLKAYRSLEATNRAQREIIEKHVEMISSLKRTDERMRVQLKAEQKARRRASR
jgi:hypothetical protein